MTTYTDNFTRADGAVGNSPTGAAYTGLGSWTIASNELVPPDDTLQTLVFDASSADVDVSITLKGNPGGDNAGLTLRWSDSSNYFRVVADSNHVYIEKRQAGSLTTLATYSGTGNPTNKVVRCVATGDSFETFFDGVSQGTQSSSFNNTATYHGAHAHLLTGITLDDLIVVVPNVTDQSVTDTITANDSDATVVVDVTKAVTDSLGANDRPQLNDGDPLPWGELVHAQDQVSVDKSGGAYTTTHYPYGALVDPSTHTYARVLAYEEPFGTQAQ